VVEKCVSFGSEVERQALIEEILRPIPAEEGSTTDPSMTNVIPLHLMMKDQFANYVIQKMLDIVDGDQKNLLLDCIKPQLPQLRKYTYGKHILAKVEKMLGISPSQPSSETASSRDYHSAPNSPVNRQSQHFDGNVSSNRTSHNGPISANYRRPPRANPKIAKNDLNEFPLLSSNSRRR
jgi:hypothetical protein